MEQLSLCSQIDSKREFINSILSFLNANPHQAGDIYADLSKVTAGYVRYAVLQDFRAEIESANLHLGGIKKEHIPEEVMDILKCWCCDKPLRECITMEEEGWTFTKYESDPYIFDRARASGMTALDENGNERMYTCGYSYS